MDEDNCKDDLTEESSRGRSDPDRGVMFPAFVSAKVVDEADWPFWSKSHES